MKLHIPRGATSRIITVFVQANNVTTGAGLSGLDQTSGIVGGYVREGSAGVALAVDENVTTEGTYQAPSTAAHVRIGTPANMRAGAYELHFHNDLWASGAESVVITLGGASNMADLTLEVQLIDPVRGLGSPTALPNAVAGAAGGIPLPIWSGTLAAVAAGSIEFPGGYGISEDAQITVEITEAGADFGRQRFATYSGTGNVWTVDKGWTADGEAALTGTPTARAFSVPAEPATSLPRVDVRQVGGTAQTAGDLAALVATLDTVADTIAARLTAARAGYLDNLNVGGLVASSAEVGVIQNNTRVNRSLPAVLERPDAGSTVFRIELACYDDAGNMETPDAAPTLDVANQGGTSRNANLDSTTMTLVSTGRYRSTYTVDAAHALEQLLFAFSVTEGGATRVYLNAILVVDTTAVDFTSADRTQLQAIFGKIPTRPYLAGSDASDGTPADSAGVTTLGTRLTAPRAANLDNLDAAVSSRAAPGAAMTLEAGERSSIVAALFAAISEGTETFIETFRIMRAGIVGKSSGHAAGTPAYRDRADLKDRITAVTTVDGDRTTVTTDGT